jgi:hypothetical protein
MNRTQSTLLTLAFTTIIVLLGFIAYSQIEINQQLAKSNQQLLENNPYYQSTQLLSRRSTLRVEQTQFATKYADEVQTQMALITLTPRPLIRTSTLRTPLPTVTLNPTLSFIRTNTAARSLLQAAIRAVQATHTATYRPK